VAQAIATARARVDAFGTGWDAPAALLTGWACDLAAWAVTNRLTIQTEGQTATKDRAQRELEDLRDGKFPGIPRTPGGSAATTGRLTYGGRLNILNP
jgi:hypothetical protein